MSRRRVLIRHEILRIAPFLGVGIFLAIWIVGKFYGNLRGLDTMWQLSSDNYSRTGFDVWGTPFTMWLSQYLKAAVSFCCLGFGLMALVQFNDVQVSKKAQYLNCLPYSQNEKFMIKSCVGFGVISLCTLGVSACVIALRISYASVLYKINVRYSIYRQLMGAETMWHTIRMLLMFWMTLLVIYSIYMAMAYLIRRPLLSFVTGFCAILWPGYLLDVFRSVVGEHQYSTRIARYVDLFDGTTLGYEWQGWGEYGYAFYPTSGRLFFDTSYHVKTNSQKLDQLVTMSYGKVWLAFLVLFLVFAGCILLAWYTNKNRDLANGKPIIPSLIGRIGFRMGVCTALSAGLIEVYSTARPELYYLYYGLGKEMIFVWVILSAVLYIIWYAIGRLIQKMRRKNRKESVV